MPALAVAAGQHIMFRASVVSIVSANNMRIYVHTHIYIYIYIYHVIHDGLGNMNSSISFILSCARLMAAKVPTGALIYVMHCIHDLAHQGSAPMQRLARELWHVSSLAEKVQGESIARE